MQETNAIRKTLKESYDGEKTYFQGPVYIIHQ